MCDEAVICAQRIIAEKSGQGLPVLKGDDYEWVRHVRRATMVDFDAKAETPAACPRIMLCIPSFKRSWQIKQTLPINLVLAWPLRHIVTFVLADLNHPLDEEIRHLMTKCDVALRCGFLRHYRRHVPEEDGFNYWHASVGKNTAHACAATLANRSILVELDNDNFVSKTFFGDIIDRGDALVEGRIAGMRWRHPAAPPCTGRTLTSSVACPREASLLGIYGVVVS